MSFVLSGPLCEPSLLRGTDAVANGDDVLPAAVTAERVCDCETWGDVLCGKVRLALCVVVAAVEVLELEVLA